jgi:hypothetical protein
MGGGENRWGELAVPPLPPMLMKPPQLPLWGKNTNGIKLFNK